MLFIAADGAMDTRPSLLHRPLRQRGAGSDVMVDLAITCGIGPPVVIDAGRILADGSRDEVLGRSAPPEEGAG